MRTSALIVAAVISITSFVTAGAVGPPVNLGFETGDFTGWSASGASVVTSFDNGYYQPPAGNFFAVVAGGCGENHLFQTFQATGGTSINGWSFFKAYDYAPYYDYGYVKIIVASPAGEVVLFSSGVGSVGDFGRTAWIPWSYAVPATGTYELRIVSGNGGDCGVSSYVGIDVQEVPTIVASFDVYNQGRANSGVSTVQAFLSDRSGNDEFSLGTGKDVSLTVALDPATETCAGDCTPSLTSGTMAHYTTEVQTPSSFGRLERDVVSPNSAMPKLDGSFDLVAADGDTSRVGFLFERYLWVKADTGDTAGETLTELRMNNTQKGKVEVSKPTFGDLTHLSANFTCNSGGSGNGTPRLEVQFGANGVLRIRLGAAGFNDSCETLNGFSGVSVLEDTAGRYDTTGLIDVTGTLLESTTYTDALGIAGGLTVTRIDFVVTDPGDAGRSFNLQSINVSR